MSSIAAERERTRRRKANKSWKVHQRGNKTNWRNNRRAHELELIRLVGADGVKIWEEPAGNFNVEAEFYRPINEELIRRIAREFIHESFSWAERTDIIVLARRPGWQELLKTILWIVVPTLSLWIATFATEGLVHPMATVWMQRIAIAWFSASSLFVLGRFLSRR